ncbi:Site-specific integrase [Planctomycetales bacterium 10988]|nr:Site-specific integrase [Planctomycetales bacterium 10988]
MSWSAFCERYEAEHALVNLSSGSRTVWRVAKNRLNESLAPKLLSDVNASLLSTFAARLRDRGLSKATIGSYLRTLRAALGWAMDIGLIREAPKIRTPKSSRRLAKGRPINEAEFRRMLDACDRLESRQDQWRHLLEGLWLSGLRASEAHRLTWEFGSGFSLDFSGKHPCFCIEQEYQKGKRDELAPTTPDFADFLQQTPSVERHGKVFKIAEKLTTTTIKNKVRKLGERACVIVNPKTEGPAGCQSFRRAFATRWASRVRPPVLQKLMRHESISTTLAYYAQLDAEDIHQEILDWQSRTNSAE